MRGSEVLPAKLFRLPGDGTQTAERM